MDFGATNHVASSLTCYSTYREINPIVVRLPTGQQVIVTHFGTVKFTEFLHLEDVLYLPSFNFNLISISKLVSVLNCKLTFFPNSCLIQDSSQRMIITVDVVEGLYKLRIPTANSVLKANNNFISIKSILSCNKEVIDIWHFRLGHPSYDRMQLLKQTYPMLTCDKTFVCHTCHRAKQRKLPFPISDSYASSPFSLI